jgi:hypothetical protein
MPLIRNINTIRRKLKRSRRKELTRRATVLTKLPTVLETNESANNSNNGSTYVANMVNSRPSSPVANSKKTRKNKH